MRGGRVVPLKTAVDEALLSCPTVTTVIVKNNIGKDGDSGSDVAMKSGRDVWMKDVMDAGTAIVIFLCIGSGSDSIIDVIFLVISFDVVMVALVTVIVIVVMTMMIMIAN